jgi:hypothetical protein
MAANRIGLRVSDSMPSSGAAVAMMTRFWKTDAFEQAFQRMYAATRGELGTFDFSVVPLALKPDRSDWIKMALVGPQGNRTYMYRL